MEHERVTLWVSTNAITMGPTHQGEPLAVTPPNGIEAVVYVPEAALARKDTELEKLREALDNLTRAFCRMPDAMLAADDPRYAWWMETLPEREAAKAALASTPEES